MCEPFGTVYRFLVVQHDFHTPLNTTQNKSLRVSKTTVETLTHFLISLATVLHRHVHHLLPWQPPARGRHQHRMAVLEVTLRHHLCATYARTYSYTHTQKYFTCISQCLNDALLNYLNQLSKSICHRLSMVRGGWIGWSNEPGLGLG